MKVTGWTDWNGTRNAGYSEVEVGRMEEARNAVIEELREHGYKFTGDYHQYGDFGTPVLDDKWVLRLSQRSWGALMVSAYPDEIDNYDGYGYTKWAWGRPAGEEMLLPNGEIVCGTY